MKTKLLFLALLFLATDLFSMQILRTELDGSNPSLYEVFFAEPGAGSAYLQYAQDISGATGEECLIIVGEGLENAPTRKIISVVAISGQIVVDNIAQ
jgi:hypothetical protein